MKQKLGDIEKLNDFSYDQYEDLIKKEFKELHDIADPTEYFLLMGDSLPWEDSEDPKKQPLFYVGDTSKWMRWLKKQRDIYRKKDNFSHGLCKISLERNRATVQLLPEEGILTRDQQNFRAVKNVFRKMSPVKVFFEVVESFDAPVAPALVRPLEIAKLLSQEHREFLKVHREWRSESDPDRKEQLNNTRKEIADDIKALVVEWDNIVVDAKLDIGDDQVLQKGHQLHEDWAERLNLDLDEDDDVGADNREERNRAFEIAEELSRQHEAFVEAHAAWKAETDPEQKAALNTARKAIAKLLGELTVEWDDLVVDTGMDISGEKALEDGNQLHLDWAERLKLDLDEEEELKEEERVYALQIDYLEEELKRIIDAAETPEKVDQQLELLVERLKAWEALDNDSPILKATQQRLKDTQEKWDNIKGLYEEWHSLYQQLGEVEDTEPILKALEETYEAIQNFEAV